MLKHKLKKSVLLSSLLIGSFGFSTFINATIVEFKTSQGSFQVNLFDQTTPKTVENFLTYLNDGHYTNSVIHRVVEDFIVQGGGYEYAGEWPLVQKSTNTAVINEPVYSNVKGTIAMAKIGDKPNSATDQWFFNLKNNSSNLDLQNSGFTAFGQVIGDGMAVIEKISKLTLCNAGGSFSSIPMPMDEGQQCADLASPGVENFVVIEHITIIDSSEVTDADLTPVKNTLITTPVKPTPDPTPTDNGGGSFTWFSLFALALITAKKRLL